MASLWPLSAEDLARAVPELLLLLISAPALWFLRSSTSDGTEETNEEGPGEVHSGNGSNGSSISRDRGSTEDSSDAFDDGPDSGETDALLGRGKDSKPGGEGRPTDRLKWAKVIVYGLWLKIALADFVYVLLFERELLPLLSRGLSLLAANAGMILSIRTHTNLPKHRRSSPLLLLLPLLVIGNAYSLYEAVHSPDPEPSLALSVTIFLLVVAFILELVPRAPFDPSLNPVQSANIFSQISYSWLSPLLRLGRSRTLILEDLPRLRKRDTAAEISRIFLDAWQKQVDRGTRSLWKAYNASFGSDFMLAGLLKLGQDLLGFVNPLLLSELISFAASYSGNPDTTPQPAARGILVAFGMLGASFLQTLLLQSYFFRVMSTALRIEAGTVSVIYEKALKAAKGEGGTSGEVVNLQSVDADRIGDVIPYLHILWSGPLQIIIALILLYQQLGPSTLVGVATILLLIPLNAWVAKIDAGLEDTLMQDRDVRSKRTEELWRGIGIVRMYGWEKSFVGQIELGRAKELKTLGKLGILSATGSLLWTCSPFFVSLSSFASFTLFSGLPLTSRRIFVSLALFNMMTFPLVVFPMIVNDLIQAIISVRRVEAYLAGAEVDPDAIIVEPAQQSRPAIEITDGTFSWLKDASQPTLDSLQLHLESGSLTAITGRVGNGKSSLLSALLGEIPKLRGRTILRLPTTVNPSVAYVPQVPYIRNGTVRSNILFNRPYDATRYDSVMDACSLRSDLVQFPFGDLTEIGSRGVNLSGGQKARIALARAAYGDDSVVLLDDPLAAVDARVARAIFDNCIGPGGIMEGRTRVLVTHGIGVLKDCDCVLAMKGGRLVEATSDIVEEVVAAEDGDNESDGTVEVDADKEKDRVGSAKKQDDSDVNETNNNGKLISVEESKQGSVGSNTYLAYIRACGILGVCTFLLLAISAQFLAVARNLWLAHWANQNEGSGTADSTGSSVKRNLMVYAALGMTQTVFVAAQQLVAKVWCALRASRNLHTEMLGTVVRAPQWWFDTVPLGRILNRFTSDVNMVDQKLVRDLSGWVYDLFVVLSVIIVDSVATPALLMFIFPLAFVYFSVGRYYVSSSRELQRLQSTTKSPVFQHFSETLNGISTIRAFGQARDFTTEARSKLDDNLRARFARFSANRWLAVRLEGIGALIVFGTALFAVLAIVRGQGRIDASVVGLIISYALSLGDSLSWLVRESCEVENSVVAVERIEEYCHLPQEPPLIVDSNRPPADWPSSPSISWDSYSTRYRPHLPLVLDNINLDIQAGEKIGLCGRTGSGKSSLALSLFRILEPTSGSISISSLPVTQNFGLSDLRSKITVIPQDAFLFVGTLRTNLAPFGEYDDELLWRALDGAHLKSVVVGMEGGLDTVVQENGENFSSGQRQLLCLARALLRRSKILILDEASANLDLTSDSLVQATIREAFSEATVITIAHRLNTILDCDRIVVLSDGKILECDVPQKLLADRTSAFYGLAKEAGLVGANRGGPSGGRDTPGSVGRATPKPLERAK